MCINFIRDNPREIVYDNLKEILDISKVYFIRYNLWSVVSQNVFSIRQIIDFNMPAKFDNKNIKFDVLKTLKENYGNI